MGQADSSSPVDASSFSYVVGVDIGSQTCSMCALKPNKSQVIKPTEFPNAPAGFGILQEKLAQLGVPPEQILIGLEATSRDAGELVPLFSKPWLSVVPPASSTNPSVCESLAACERKRTNWMRPPLRGCS